MTSYSYPFIEGITRWINRKPTEYFEKCDEFVMCSARHDGTAGDTMSHHLINHILRKAKTTFSSTARHTTEDFSKHYAELKSLVNKIKAEDINVDRARMVQHVRQGSRPQHGRWSPVSYIGIHEDNDISVGVFIVRPGQRIPLHNHPGMFGIIKLLLGEVELRTYSMLTQRRNLTIPSQLLDRKRRELEAGYVFPVTRHPVARANKDSECCCLFPDENNFHELVALESEDPVAFLDILAPPYNPQGVGEEHRDCDFFADLSGFVPENSSTTWFQVIDPPSDYYCDTEVYEGPELQF